MLVAFEGIDGSGKTTLATSVASILAADYPTHFVGVAGFEPIDAVTTALLADPDRYDATAHFLLSSANSRVLAKTIIVPQCAERRIVLIDRYVHSSVAYSAPLGVSLHLMEAVIAELPAPDLVVFCRVSVRTAFRRRGKAIRPVETGSVDTTPSAFERYQSEVANLYDNLLSADPGQWMVVSTDDTDDLEAASRDVASSIARKHLARATG